MHGAYGGTPPRLRTSDFVPGAGPAVRAYRQTLHRDSGVGSHWHEFFELGYVISGRGRHVCNGRAYDLAPGSAFLLTPADIHAVTPIDAEPMVLHDVVFTPVALSPAARELLLVWAPGRAQPLEAQPQLGADLDRLWAEESTTAVGRSQVQQATLERVLVDLFRGVGLAPATSGGRADDPIRQVAAWLDQAFAQSISLADAAARAGYSPGWFSARFREVTGQSFQSYLMERRLAFARSLLDSTDAGVTEVCHASGFGSLSHFDRAFRQRCGMAPREWRQRSRPAGTGRAS